MSDFRDTMEEVSRSEVLELILHVKISVHTSVKKIVYAFTL